ncbi:MAG: hypothetical protein V7603_407 [Micromonosporaceae bacterium]
MPAPLQPAPVQPASVQPAPPRPAVLWLGRVWPARVWPGRVWPGRFRSAPLRPGRVRLDLGGKGTGSGAIAAKISPGRAALAVVGGVAARGALAGVRGVPGAAALERTNFRGRTVTLAAGPALALAASTAAALGAASVPVAAAALTAGLGSGAVGLYDDVVGARPEQKSAAPGSSPIHADPKGFGGHLSALREGRVTSGLVKIGGVGAAALAASALLAAAQRRDERGSRPGGTSRGRGGAVAEVLSGPAADRRGDQRRGDQRRGPGGLSRGRAGAVVDVLLGAGVIAGTANLVNLLDLRPGRALKAGGALGLALAGTRSGGIVAGPVGAAAALLPADLGEEVMLGDAGANALGALLGVALVADAGRARRAALLAVLAGLTAASEKVSFTKVIESTPVLRELDALGRSRPGAQVSEAARSGAAPSGPSGSGASESGASGSDAPASGVSRAGASRSGVPGAGAAPSGAECP